MLRQHIHECRARDDIRMIEAQPMKNARAAIV